MCPPTVATSFRDPAGSVALLPDRVLRWVFPEGQPNLEAFLGSDAVAAARRTGSIPAVRVMPPEEADETMEEHDGTTPSRERVANVLVQERIPFPSFPYEWPAEMLQAAGELTLDLHDALLAEGRGLKDATPYNVLFDGPRPVFVDILSVEPRDPHDPVWRPYGQFVRTFLLPLLAARDQGVPLSWTFLAARDGLEPEMVYAMASRWQRLRRPYRSLVTLPTWLSKRAETQGEGLYQPKDVADPQQARFVLEATSRSLRRHLRRSAPNGKGSTWTRYMAERAHYDEDDAARKESFVEEVLRTVAPQRVLDVGCNTGHFSIKAARAGCSVVAIDRDPSSVAALWRRAADEGLDVLPLVVDVARPSPALGWRNRESPSFLERAEVYADLTLFLAVMHHLHVMDRIPLAEIVDLAHRLSRGHVLFEYVGPEDPMFRRLLRGRGELHRGLDRERFEEALEGRFDVVLREPLEASDRVLYLLRRIDPVQDAPAVAATRPLATP